MSSIAPTHSIQAALRVALESTLDPAVAAADWLARDIDPACESAQDLLTNPKVSLMNLKRAKAVYKTMRILGETSADRRLAAHLYVASIAAGLVRHGQRITSQSEAALQRGLKSLADDVEMPARLRELAARALRKET